MTEEHFRSLGGVAVLLLMLGLFAWLIMAGRSTDTATALYPDQDLSTIGQGGGLQFVNGYANW
jgi:hypothetical protein